MIIKYGIEISTEAITKDIDRITNQIFKLLPSREEGGEWEAPLNNLILELGGMSELLKDQQLNLFILLCKLETLYQLKEEEDFFQFRRIIFECLSLLNQIKKEVLTWAD